MSTLKFQFAPPQITLSQYEYRIARLPTRKYSQCETPVDEHQPEEGLSITESRSKPVVSGEVSPSNRRQLRFDQVELEETTNDQNQSFNHHHMPQSQHAAEFSAPLPTMIFMNDDDLELLQLGETDDHGLSRPNGIDDMLVLHEIENDSQPSMTKRKRRSAKLASIDPDFVDIVTPRPRKRRKRGSDSVMLRTDQLIMVPHEADDSLTLEDEPDPASSPPEDPIEDTPPQYTTQSRKTKSRLRSTTTVPGSQLRRQVMSKLSAAHDTMPGRRSGRLAWSTASERTADIGDGFSEDERGLLYTSVRKCRGVRTRGCSLPMAALEMGVFSAGITTSETSYYGDGGHVAPLDDSIPAPTEEIEEYVDEKSTERGRSESPHAKSARDYDIARMSREMATNDVSRTSKPTARSTARPQGDNVVITGGPVDSLSMVAHVSTEGHCSGRTSKDTPERQAKRPAEASAPAVQKHERTRRTQARGIDKTNIPRPVDYGDGADLVAPHQQSAVHLTDDEACPYLAFFHPGNLQALRQVPDHDESHEAIEDDEPWMPRARLISRLEMTITASEHRSPSPAINALGGPSNAIGISPTVAEAAYPTPQTMTRRFQQRDIRQVSPLRETVSRRKHDRLAEDIMDEDLDDSGQPASTNVVAALTYDLTVARPIAANLSPTRVSVDPSTQLANSSMMFDNDAEVVWDGSIRPSDYPQTQNLHGLRHRPVQSPSSRRNESFPRHVSLGDLTRTVSHRFGTKSPEKRLQRKVSCVATFKPPFKA